MSLSSETNINMKPSLSIQTEKTIPVYIRLVFLRIGEIDTLNEKYQAHASIESRWPVLSDEFISKLSKDDQNRLLEGKSILIENYSALHWHPQLYIENSLGDLKEQIKYSAKRNSHDNQIYICEHRIIKGLFWEKLELHHFPTDIQDLSISIASTLYQDKVLLYPDPFNLSGVNREAFVDQQEWTLYEHVDSEQRFIKDFLFLTDINNDDQDIKYQTNKEEPKRSVVTVTCHAARQSEYFYWNGYFLILLITSVSFCTFGMPMQVAINRLQVSCTLLLTSVTFRWTVNRSLPTVSYLTSLDKYAIICMCNLILHAIWHSIISALAWKRTPDYRVTGDMSLAYLDHGAFYVLLSLFVLLHIIIIIWFIRVPYKIRQQMKLNDEKYRASVLEMANNRNR